jgi:small multidrug resistance pump
MSWIYLTLAIITEVSGTVCLKLSDGFSKLWPSILIFVFYAISFSFTTLAVKKIDLSVVYAIWSGLGTALVVIVAILYFKEPVTLLKILSISLIVLGVIGLNLGSSVH